MIKHRYISAKAITIASYIIVIIAIALQWQYMNAMPSIVIPSSPLPKKNAYDDFCAAGRLLHDPNTIYLAASRNGFDYRRPELVHIWSFAEKQSLVKYNAKALAIVRRELSNDFCCPPCRSEKSALIPYGRLEALGMLIILDGQVNAGKRDWVNAMDSYLTAMQYAMLMPRGGNINALRASERIQFVAHQNIREIIGHLTPYQLKAAIRRIEAIDRLHIPYSDMLMEFKWILVVDHLEAMKDRNLLEALHYYRSTHTTEPDRFIDRLPVLIYSKSGIIEALINHMDKSIARARQPYNERVSIPAYPQDPFYLPGSWDIDDGDWCSDLLGQTEIRLITIALALRGYQLENGHLPASLFDLAPAYMSQVPYDPFFNDRKLRYRRIRHHYTIYSVGPDGRDDNGKPIKHPESKTTPLLYIINCRSIGDICITNKKK